MLNRTHSSAAPTSVKINSLNQGIHFYISITRFEEFRQDLFRSALDPVEEVLRDSKIDKPAVKDIVSSVVPLGFLVTSHSYPTFFNSKEPDKSIKPNEVVAYGTAVQAAILISDT